MTPEWITAISSVVAAAGVIIVAIQAVLASRQLKLTYDQVKADHERSRRETTVRVLKEWSSSVNVSWTSARRMAERLTLEECSNIFFARKAKIPQSLEASLRAAMQPVWTADHQPVKVGEHIVLEERETAHLKAQLVSYLNHLETALAAWSLAVADREFIEHQFAYLLKPEDGQEALATFRQAAGGKRAYPVIAEFIEKLKEIRDSVTPKSKPNVA